MAERSGTDRLLDRVPLLSRIPFLAAQWRAGKLREPMFAALYFLYSQMAQHGERFATRRNKHDVRPDAQQWLSALESEQPEQWEPRLLDWLTRYQFHGVRISVPIALQQWLRGFWSLQLRDDVPSPLELLSWQARGTRIVTALSAWPRLREPVLDQPDAYAFFRHDLEHAYQFFHRPHRYRAQCSFFAALKTAIDNGVFESHVTDPQFAKKLAYLMSDMNTHPEHSRQYLRAALVEHYLRREGKVIKDSLTAVSERSLREVMNALSLPADIAVCA